MLDDWPQMSESIHIDRDGTTRTVQRVLERGEHDALRAGIRDSEIEEVPDERLDLATIASRHFEALNFILDVVRNRVVLYPSARAREGLAIGQEFARSARVDCRVLDGEPLQVAYVDRNAIMRAHVNFEV